MKNSQSPGSRRAFTLIELLIVVSIIAIVAALMFPVMTSVSANRVKNVAYGELNQIATAIEAYKGKKGYYPPGGHATNLTVSPLYYELVGTTNNGQKYLPLDGRDFPGGITTNQMYVAFGVGSFGNSGRSAQGSDDGSAPQSFLKEVKPLQVGTSPIGGARVLVCSEGGLAGGRWGYNPVNPTNNPNTFDLWVDIVLKGKTNRINNWSKQPQILR